MEHVTRSIWLSRLQSSMVRGGAYQFLPYSTLNEKFGVLPGEYPGTGTYPVMQFLAIGRGGKSTDTDGDLVIAQHKSTDAALFEHMPFSLRPLDDDLPTERRSRYAMRVQVEYFGTPYWAYYLRRKDFSQADTDLFIKTVMEDKSIIVNDFEPDESNLNPVPEVLSESGTNLLAGSSAIASTIIELGLDEFDIAEIRNASKIIKRKTGKATITELAICTGSLKEIRAPLGTGTFVMQEAVGVQIASFIQALYALDYINESLTDQLELGISEPLFRVEGVNA